MVERNAPNPDDILTRATETLRRQPVPPGPSPEVLRGVIAAEPLVQQAEPRQKKGWFTMKRVGSIAAAAVVALAVGMAAVLLGFPKPSYALAQTVEAVKKVRFIHLVCRGKDGPLLDERWIELGPDGKQVRYRQNSPTPDADFLVVIEDGKTVAVHLRDKNTIVLYTPEQQQFQFIGDFAGFFRDLEGSPGSVVIQRNVDYGGRRAHLVRWLKLNQDIYIDPETKLPIAMGTAERRYEMSYEQPPTGTFDIQIPKGVKVVDMRPGAPPTEAPDWLKGQDSAKETFGQGRAKLAEAQAAKALAMKEYKSAAELFAQAVAAQPGFNWGWFWLGSAHYELGDYDAALKEFSRAIEMLAPHGAPHYAHLARGLAYARKGMEQDARKDFAVALPAMILALRNPEGAEMFDYADDPLYGAHKEDVKYQSRPQTLARMFERLRLATGQAFAYDPAATAEQTEKAISACENWWNAHRTEYDTTRR